MNAKGGLAMPWSRGPIYEPKDSNFRPWSLTTLFGFLVGRFFGGLLRRERTR